MTDKLPKIGFTERGDAGRDTDTWYGKCLRHEVDGVVAVTKSLTNKCGDALLDLHKRGFPCILHLTCTGWGGTWMEPNAFPLMDQLSAAQALMKHGFPMDHVVLRIDPVVPTNAGIAVMTTVLQEACNKGFFDRKDGMRLRMSIFDNYPHVVRRFQDAGKEPLYGGKFQPEPDELDYAFWRIGKIWTKCKALNKNLPRFEVCGEPRIHRFGTVFPEEPYEINVGCLSKKDLSAMGFTVPATNIAENGQHRNGCHCLQCKTELLEHKHPCANNCIYCYWK